MLVDTSLPSWERGLKYSLGIKTIIRKVVAPLVGAWIEISVGVKHGVQSVVAPLVGAWIEILIVTVPQSISVCRSPRGSVD